jgi:hypothetical protein
MHVQSRGQGPISDDIDADYDSIDEDANDDPDCNSDSDKTGDDVETRVKELHQRQETFRCRLRAYR